MGWIAQQKRLIETASWGDDAATIQQQLISHQKFHSSIQRSHEVDRARDDLLKKGDKGNLYHLEQEWDSLQQMSFGRTQQLQDLQQIIQEMSQEIMWVNGKEEEELMFDWGDKNIDQYIPRKQESYSKLMSALEDKEKDLNKLKAKVDTLLKNNHPASDKIEAYKDTLQTQWSWLLQITKCIDVHLKENAAYNQFFKEANETYSNLQKEHETVRKNFTCDKNTSLEDLLELLRGLEREKEKIMENKRQVSHLVNRSKSIVRLKPRNPEEKSGSTVIVKALCDFKQDHKVICKDNEAILKDNSQRSKWDITGPGGLDMSVPSVCLIVPPPNPLSVSLANKNEQYYEAILSIWNQLYINVKSLIAWQYCLLDIRHINSLTISMLAKMRPEEYRQIMKNLETHFQEFKVSCHGSQMFVDEDKRAMENQFNGAQAHYDRLVVQLPTYSQYYRNTYYKETDEAGKKKVVVSSSSTCSSSSSRSLSELHALRLRLEAAEGMLSQHVHICLGEDGEGSSDILISHIICKIYMYSFSFFHLATIISLSIRLQALRNMLESVAQAEDIVKVHEARLTEKETTSLSPSEVEDYMLTLKNIKAELDQKKDILASMEAELAKASHWNGQVDGPFQRCDLMLSKYTDQVSLLSDRWRRLYGQIDTRIQDLQLYQPQLQHYKKTSVSLIDWIDATRKKQDALQATKIDNIQTSHIFILLCFKALNSEIKLRRETVESVLKDNEACVNSIKDYETDLASYTSGLETLLNIPIKRTMLRSPTMDLNQEATQLQTHYMELLTWSGDYYKFLGELLKNMEELKVLIFILCSSMNIFACFCLTFLYYNGKQRIFTLLKVLKITSAFTFSLSYFQIRNTRIDVLEEDLRLLRENIQDSNDKNKSLEDAVARYRLELSQSQDQLLSMEEVKQSAALQCSTTRESLDTTQSQLADLNDQVTRLNYLLEEEKRKRRLAEERYTQQQEEYDSVLRKRQKELETVSWSKMEVEKSVASRDHEIEQLRRQLAEEAGRVKELQKEMSKVRSQCSTEINNLKLTYESQIHVSRTDIQRLASQREEDTAELQRQYDRMVAERRNLEEDVLRLRMSINDAEEQRNRAEEEAHSQRAVITEEGRRRRELESQMEALMRQRDEERSQYAEELAEVMKSLQEKSEELAYITHSLEEETRRRKTIEEGQGVLEQTLSQMQVKLTSSSVVATQLGECQDALEKMRLELEREKRERSRLEQNMSRLQGRMKDLQEVRDGLESQVENLRRSNQEEVTRRRQLETELENTTIAMKDYTSTIMALRQSQDQASMSEKRNKEECLRLQEELDRSLRQNNTSAERMTQLSAELKALQQQLLQEQARVKEANLRNESLYRTSEERSKALNENTAELQKLKEMVETQTKERLKLEEELRAVRHDKEELLRSKQECNDELSSQITALELQLQDSERSSIDYRNLVSELSSEREKLKMETEKIQSQATETTATMQSIKSQYNEIVMERDALLMKLKLSESDRDRLQKLEEELSHIKLSLETELRSKQRIQEENERMKRDLGYWKDQYESKQGLIRQCDTDKERLEREKSSLKTEIERLMRELRELEESYKSKLSAIQKELREVTIVRQTMETELKRAKEPPPLDGSTVIFDGVRKSVTANQLLDCGVLDKPTFSQLVKGHKTVPDVSVDKKISLKGTGPIAGVVIEGPKGPGSITGVLCKMTLTEAKRENLLPPDSVGLLLDAQAATGHIIDPKTNKKLTVEEALNQGVIDEEDRERLLAAEAAAVGYSGPGTSKPLSVFEAMKRGLIDKNTALRLLQAQESVGGILDPILSVFLPKDTAIERNLIDDDIYRALNQRPELYLDPESEDGVTYMSMKRRCKVELHTGLLLLPIPEKVDPSKLVFDGVRKPVTAKQLVDCGVLDKPSFKDLEKGKKTVPEVSVDKNVNLKGTGPIAGVIAGSQGKMSLSEAKKKMLLPEDSADLLLEAQAATGHIIDPRTNQKLTVEEACTRGVVDIRDRDKLLAAEAAAVGYKDPRAAKPLSVFEAMKKGIIDRKTGLRLLQAQESVGGILDPNLSVFLPKDTAIKRNLLDENLRQALNQSPECYLDPETEQDATYGALKKRCKTEPHTGLLLLPITEKLDPSTLIFDGVRKPVTAQQLLDCGVLDKPTFNQLMKGEKTVPEVSMDKKVFLKGTGSIAGIGVGPLGKISLSEAKKQMLLPADSADLLLDAQAATGHIIDPTSNQKLTAASGFIVDPVNNTYLTVSDAYNKRLFGPEFKDNLLSAERAVTGYKLPGTDKTISLFQAIERSLVEKGHGIRLLEAQIASGGIIDPEHSHRIDVNVAYKRGYFDEKMNKILTDQSVDSKGFFDPNTEENLTYLELKKRCITDKKTGLILLPIMDKKKLESTQKNTLRKRRVVIVDPETNKEMTVREAYDKGYIDYDTFQELSEQECEWEEITITAPDGSTRFVIIDKKTGRQYDITELLEKGVINQSELDQYRSRTITLTQFADIITDKTKHGSSSFSTARPSAASGTSSVKSSSSASRSSAATGTSSMTSSSTLRTSEVSVPPSVTSSSSSSSSLLSRPLSPTLTKMTTTRTTTVTSGAVSSLSRDSPDSFRNICSVSISLAAPVETVCEQEPVGAIFDTEALEKISITEAKNRGLVDSITAQRLLEAQACTGGIINPTNGQRFGIKEASRLGIINEDMVALLKPAQKAYIGFEDVKTRKKMSAAEALKEMWLPYEAGMRFMEFQYITGGLYDPEKGCRRSIEDALKMGWLDGRAAQKLQDTHHIKILTCPKSKLKISYKEALDNCMVEEKTGVKMLQASSVSSRGISSPYNVSSAPGSSTGSRSGSRRSSRRSSVDLGSPSSFSSANRHFQTSYTSYTSTK
uniref:Desmoplakin b n=1 Tax=Dicentrarchus labrax TaxID=13489 RepID=A0A8C4GX11_DICLA